MPSKPIAASLHKQNREKHEVELEVTGTTERRHPELSRTLTSVKYTAFTAARIPFLAATTSGVWGSALSSVATQVGSLLLMLMVARILGKLTYGRFAMVLSTGIALTGLASLGLGITATKYVSQHKISEPLRVGRILGLSSLVACVVATAFVTTLLVFAPAIASNTLGAPELANELRLSTPFVLFTILGGYQVGALAGFGAFSRAARMNTLGTAISLVTAYLLIRSYGLDGAICALGTQAFLLWVLNRIALRAECRGHNITLAYSNLWSERQCLFTFSVPAALAGVIASLAMWYANALLVRQANGFGEMALFSAAASMRAIVMFAPNIISRVTSPLLNGILARGDYADYRRSFKTSILLIGGSGLFVALVVILGSSYLLRLFGKDFKDPNGVVFTLLAATVVEIIAGSVYQALFVHGRLWLQVAVIAAWSVCLTLSASALVYRGALGLAFAFLISWSMCAAMYAGLAHRLNARITPIAA